MALMAAVAFLAVGTATPALAAPPLRGVTAPPAECIPVEDGCISVDAIGEHTEIYIGHRPDGSVTGFTNFSGFSAWAKNTYGVTFTRSGGRIHFDLSGGGNGDGPDDRSAQAQFATFYNSPLLRGEGFVLDGPNVINNLNLLPRPSGGSWNNRISSVRIVGGNPSLPGVVLCAAVGCSTGSPVLLNNGSALTLTGGLNNTASFVGVFA
jgi:hypothetical protein